jgi:outer membrane lipoprotein carrier protein
MIILRFVLLVSFLLWIIPMRAESSFVPSTFHVDFEQIQKSSISKKERVSQGHMKFHHPNKLYFKVTSPDEVVFTTDGKLTYYYTAPFIEGEAGELTIQDSGKNSLTQFFSALSSGLESNKAYQVETLKDNQVKLSFENALKSELSMESATFEFESNTREFDKIKKLVLKQTDGVELTLVFKKIEVNAKVDKSIFEFTPPKNTNIIR